MKTRKQVFDIFADLQKQLFADQMQNIVKVNAYNDGEYWVVEILVTHYDWAKQERDLWETCEWKHRSPHSEDDEMDNIAKLEEFKSKFNLK